MEDILGKHCYEVTHQRESPCKPPHDPCPIYEVQKTGKPTIVPHTHFDKKGNKIFVEVSAYPLKDEKGEIVQYVHLTRDVTERMQAEEALQESEEKLRATFDAIDDVITIQDKALNILWTNEATKLRFGDVKGRKCYKVYKGEERQCTKCVVKETFADGKTHSSEEEGRLKDGTPWSYLVTSSPMRDEDSNIFAVVEVFKDITERKVAEEAIKKYTRELEEANRMKDLFTDIMRHDILNQVTVIGSSSEFMLDGESDSEKRELTLMINESAERLTEMIEAASKYAMLEELEDVDLKTFDIDDALKEALEIYESPAKEKNITIEYHPGRGCIVKAVPLIKDVFSNLLANAIKYSPNNTKVVIEVQEGPPCIIAVKDNGPGIPDKEKERIFERFTRGSKMGVKGSGLGLAIVRRIVDLHKGRVWVEDNPEGGSIFKVEIPA
jgi:PAS domain S-box-containing protein